MYFILSSFCWSKLLLTCKYWIFTSIISLVYFYIHFENAIENWIFAHNSSLFTTLTQKLLLIDFSLRIMSFFPNVEHNAKLNKQTMQFLKQKSYSALLLLDFCSRAPSQSFPSFSFGLLPILGRRSRP